MSLLFLHSFSSLTRSTGSSIHLLNKNQRSIPQIKSKKKNLKDSKLNQRQQTETKGHGVYCGKNFLDSQITCLRLSRPNYSQHAKKLGKNFLSKQITYKNYSLTRNHSKYAKKLCNKNKRTIKADNLLLEKFRYQPTASVIYKDIHHNNVFQIDSKTGKVPELFGWSENVRKQK